MEARVLTEKAQDVVEKARGRVRDWQEQASDTARRSGRVVHAYVHENAWSSIAVAAVIGCVIGILIMRGRE